MFKIQPYYSLGLEFNYDMTMSQEHNINGRSLDFLHRIAKEYGIEASALLYLATTIIESALNPSPAAYNEKLYLFSRHVFVRTHGIFNVYVNSIIGKLIPLPEAYPSSKSKTHLDQIYHDLTLSGYSASSYESISDSDYTEITSFLDSASLLNPGQARTFVDDLKIMLSFRLVQTLIDDSNIWLLADKYLKCKSILTMCTAWKKSVGLKSRALSERSNNALMFHFDADNNRFLKIFIYLNDVCRDSGPHVAVYGTQAKYRHKLPDQIQYDGRIDNSTVLNLGLSPTVFLGQRGTIIYGDTHCLHRGTPLRQGKARYILQLQFSDSFFGAKNNFENILSLNKLRPA